MTDNAFKNWLLRWWKTDCRRCLQMRAALLWGLLMYILLTLFWWS